MSTTVTISDDLLDKMVDALTHLPYRQVQHIFVQLGHEMAEKPEDKPQIIQPSH